MNDASLAKRMAGYVRAERRRFGRFLVVGVIAALVNIVSRILLDSVMSYGAAIIVAYGLGMTTAYILNRFFVFDPSARPVHHEYVRFTIVNLVSLSIVLFVSMELTYYLLPAIGFTWHTETVAHIIGVMVPTLTSYFGYRYFSFARPRQ